jgi:hypothetical protein
MMMKSVENRSQDTAAVVDSLCVMIQKEHAMYTRTRYLDPYEPTIITADDRMKIVDWCYGVVDHCHFSREVVASAMDMVDRFLSMHYTDEAFLRNQIKFQLLTITALYVAIKINEYAALSSNQFADMSLGVYTAEEIEDVELTLLTGLSWRCNAPTAHQVGHAILSLILSHVDIDIRDVTCDFLMDEMKYLTELAVRDYYISAQRASTIAMATIFNAIGRTPHGHERQQLLEAFICIVECFDFDDFKLVVAASKRLHYRVIQQEESHDHDHDDFVTEVEMEVPEASTKYPEMSSVNTRRIDRMRQRLCFYLKELELHHRRQEQDDPKQSPRLVSHQKFILFLSHHESVCGKAA